MLISLQRSEHGRGPPGDQQAPDHLNSVDNIRQNGGTDMHVAAFEGRVDRIEKLLKKDKTECDRQDNVGQSPLMVAAYRGYFKIVKRLIEAKADTWASDKWGHDPLMLAAHNGHLEVLEYLLMQRSGSPVVSNNVDNRDKAGWTALMFGARYGHSRVVHRLMKAKADINAQNNDRYSAFIFAAWFGHWDVLKLLGDARADPNIQNKFGETARYFAEAFANDSVLQLVHKYENLAEIRRLNRVVMDRDSTIMQMRMEYDELESRYKARMEADALRIAGLKATVLAHRKVIAQLRQDITDLKIAFAEERATLEAQIRNVTHTMEVQIKLLTKKCHDLEQDNSAKNKDILQRMAKMDQQEYHIRELNRISAQQMRKIKKLSDDVNTLTENHRAKLKQMNSFIAAREAAAAAMKKIATKIVEYEY